MVRQQEPKDRKEALVVLLRKSPPISMRNTGDPCKLIMNDQKLINNEASSIIAYERLR